MEPVVVGRWSVDWKKWGVMIFLLLITWVWQQWPDTRLRVVFCDVGQGDGAVVILGSFQAVIDTGASESLIGQCLADHVPFWDSEIEVVFISHGDKDHAGAMTGIKKHYSVGRVVDEPMTGDVVRYGNLYFDIIKGKVPEGENEVEVEEVGNEGSIVMEMRFGSFSALFTGDIGLVTELALVRDGVLEKIDILKVPHHGSKYSSGPEFLETLSPAIAVISVGGKNSYGHPHGDTLSRLDAVGANILRTDQTGTIEFRIDGEKIEIFRAR